MYSYLVETAKEVLMQDRAPDLSRASTGSRTRQHTHQQHIGSLLATTLKMPRARSLVLLVTPYFAQHICVTKIRVPLSELALGTLLSLIHRPPVQREVGLPVGVASRTVRLGKQRVFAYRHRQMLK